MLDDCELDELEVATDVALRALAGKVDSLR